MYNLNIFNKIIFNHMLRFWSFVVLLTFTLIGYSQSTLRITSPASIAGDIAITKGLLGNGFVDTIKGELVLLIMEPAPAWHVIPS